jgi:hypothetical protein
LDGEVVAKLIQPAVSDRSHCIKTALLFDHFVGASQELWVHVEAETSSRFHVDDELELSRLQPPKDSISAISRGHVATHSQIESVAVCEPRRALFAELRCFTKRSLVQHALSNVIAGKQQ